MAMLMCPVCSISAFTETRAVGSATQLSTLTISSSTATCYSMYRDSNVANASFTNTKPRLASGTYRVKYVFNVTLNYGTTETITIYSSTVEI